MHNHAENWRHRNLDTVGTPRMPTSIQRQHQYHDFNLLWSAVDSQQPGVQNIPGCTFSLGIDDHDRRHHFTN